MELENYGKNDRKPDCMLSDYGGSGGLQSEEFTEDVHGRTIQVQMIKPAPGVGNYPPD